MEDPLTSGGVHQLIEAEGHFSGGPYRPTLQIINIRRVPANALTDVYWAVLSDGEKCIEVVISTHLSHLVQSGQLIEHTIIEVKAWQYNITDDNIHIVSISEIDILEGNPKETIGHPVSVLDSIHKHDVKDGNHYFDVEEEEWDDDSETEEPLTWSLDEPSDFCDWTIEVTRIHSSSSGSSSSSSVASSSSNTSCQLGKDRHGSISSRHSKDHKGKENNSSSSFHHKDYRDNKDTKDHREPKENKTPTVQKYHVHKAILSVGPRRSDYFATLFKQSHLSESTTSTSRIHLENSAADAFPSILDYIYSDKNIKFTSRNATAVRHLAHYFGIRSLWKCASAYIKGDFSLDTAPTYLSEALLYHDEKLERASIDILAERIEEISRRALTKLPPSSFERIVTSPQLKCRSKKLSEIVLKYCQTQGDAVDMPLLMKWTRCERMPSVSRKAALPLLKIAVAGEEKAGVNLANTNNVLRARCVEACVEEWKETLAKPLLAIESRDKNISRILGANSIEHRDLPKEIQIELLEKALCAAKVELDDVKAELLYREEQVEELSKKRLSLQQDP